MKPNKVREARLRKRLTQAQVAKILNISQQTYSRWERDLTQLPLERAIDLQRAVGLPPGGLALDCLDLVQALVYRTKQDDVDDDTLTTVVRILESEYLPLLRERLGLAGRPLTVVRVEPA